MKKLFRFFSLLVRSEKPSERLHMMVDSVCPVCKSEGVTFNSGPDREFTCDKNGCKMWYNIYTREIELL